MSFTDQMQVFVRVAELSSFTQAAAGLGLPKASVSTAVQQLEARLGTRLLHRTTRRVQLTQDGQVFYERCKDLLADVDEVETLFQQPGNAPLQGRVRIDMSPRLALRVVLPRLPRLLAEHPQLEIELSCTDRRVDVVREGFDCVMRAGPVIDAGLVARPLGRMRMVNCASPAYLAAHGVPQRLEDLEAHRLVRYAATLGGRAAGFEYLHEGQLREWPMTGVVTVNNADAYEAACLAGLGLMQAPLAGLQDALASGRLVEVLADWPAPPMPLNLLYANRRHLSRRVRVVMDWLAAVVTEDLAGADVPE